MRISPNISDAYHGSNGGKTWSLLCQLGKLHGGRIAVSLFRAAKSSERAKRYRGGLEDGTSFRSLAYEKKGAALKQLCLDLKNTTLTWGWGIDESQSYAKYVLYIDLPTGQVSFHSTVQYDGPDYHANWDGVRNVSTSRILEFCSMVQGRYFEAGTAKVFNICAAEERPQFAGGVEKCQFTEERIDHLENVDDLLPYAAIETNR